MRFLRRLLFFRRRARAAAAPIREADAYARSYGDRSGEIISVALLPAEPAAEPEPAPALVEHAPPPDPQRIPRRTGDMTGELLRRAFEAKLDARGKPSHASRGAGQLPQGP